MGFVSTWIAQKFLPSFLQPRVPTMAERVQYAADGVEDTVSDIETAAVTEAAQMLSDSGIQDTLAPILDTDPDGGQDAANFIPSGITDNVPGLQSARQALHSPPHTLHSNTGRPLRLEDGSDVLIFALDPNSDEVASEDNSLEGQPLDATPPRVQSTRRAFRMAQPQVFPFLPANSTF